MVDRTLVEWSKYHLFTSKAVLELSINFVTSHRWQWRRIAKAWLVTSSTAISAPISLSTVAAGSLRSRSPRCLRGQQQESDGVRRMQTFRHRLVSTNSVTLVARAKGPSSTKASGSTTATATRKAITLVASLHCRRLRDTTIYLTHTRYHYFIYWTSYMTGSVCIDIFKK